MKLSADATTVAPFIEVAGDDRIRVLLARQEGRLAQSLRKNGLLGVELISLQEAKLAVPPTTSSDGRAGWCCPPRGLCGRCATSFGTSRRARGVAAMGSTTQLGGGGEQSRDRAQPRGDGRAERLHGDVAQGRG